MTYLLVKHRVGFGPLLNSMAKVMLFCFLPLHLKKIVISCWVSFSGRLKTSPHTCEESIKDKLIIKCECQQINYIHTYTFFFISYIFFFHLQKTRIWKTTSKIEKSCSTLTQWKKISFLLMDAQWKKTPHPNLQHHVFRKVRICFSLIDVEVFFNDKWRIIVEIIWDWKISFVNIYIFENSIFQREFFLVISSLS